MRRMVALCTLMRTCCAPQPSLTLMVTAKRTWCWQSATSTTSECARKQADMQALPKESCRPLQVLAVLSLCVSAGPDVGQLLIKSQQKGFGFCSQLGSRQSTTSLDCAVFAVCCRDYYDDPAHSTELQGIDKEKYVAGMCAWMLVWAGGK